MRLIADWHVHSRYSRACSKDLELPNTAKWCERKGIDVVATGDWTHPKWVEHLKEHLVESEPGLYKLKDGSSKTRFMLVTEVSQIYKKGDKTRRVHNLVFAPSLETVDKVNAWLDEKKFNRRADGRPILGIDSEMLYEALKGIDERIIVVPAHAWTPWYSVFGSKSGFDSLEECFGRMTPYIHAIETGLSSDPKMNWMLSALDDVVMISNSDAHSPRKLGREANVFDLEEPSYDAFVDALKAKDPKRFLYTIEFFPDEGKYHLDGCADDKFSCTPKESLKLGGRCPKCGKLLTLGVEHRVEALADRGPEAVAHKKIPFKSIVPLEEVIADAFGVAPTSKKVMAEYLRLTDTVANEFSLLLETPIEQIAAGSSDPLVAEAVRRVREGRLKITPGYDGIYGTVKIFGDDRPAKRQSKLL
jgi:uncharacterized protein (TIGR00375 family)